MQDTDRGESRDAQAFFAQLADDLAQGEEVSPEALAGAVYADLKALARRLFQSERVGLTLQPTALAHEAYLRLADYEGIVWESRPQFLAAASTAMRRVLADAARERSQLKRGGAFDRVTLTGNEPMSVGHEWDLIDLENALQELAAHKPRHARIAELRYFGGLTMVEVAKVLGVSQTAIDRDWVKARAYLAARLRSIQED